jgi:hypothetical protein
MAGALHDCPVDVQEKSRSCIVDLSFSLHFDRRLLVFTCRVLTDFHQAQQHFDNVMLLNLYNWLGGHIQGFQKI